MGILDFFSREAGQERRRALDSLLSQFIPPTARPQFNLLGELNPVVAMERAGQDAQRIGATQGWERVGATGDMLSNMAGVVAPALAMRGAGRPVAQAVEEGLLGFSTSPQGLALGDFAADEDGALRLFHGSPHDFDRFSMDKIGTGEGAQAYGHGLYFAENRGVAESYRDALGAKGDILYDRLSEQDLSEAGIAELTRRRAAYEDAAARARQDALDLFLKYGGKDGERPWLVDPRTISVPKLGGQYDPSFRAMVSEANPSMFRSGAFGRLYEVEVAADPADFLDWDAPLSAQPQVARRLGLSVRSPDEINAEAEAIMMTGPGGKWMEDPAKVQRVRELQDELDNAVPPMTGQEYYRGGADGDVSNILSQMGYGNPEAQSAALREAGIPGIRYLDAGSRGAGDGSRNYVVFDENLITIIRKYGIAGAAAMLGMSQADLAQAMERQQQSQPMGLLNMGAR